MGRILLPNIFTAIFTILNCLACPTIINNYSILSTDIWNVHVWHLYLALLACFYFIILFVTPCMIFFFIFLLVFCCLFSFSVGCCFHFWFICVSVLVANQTETRCITFFYRTPLLRILTTLSCLIIILSLSAF